MNRIDKAAKKHNLNHLHSAVTGQPHYAWFRDDLLLYMVLSVEGKYEIRANTHEIGHIDFTEHIYDTLDEAGEAMNKIELQTKT